MLERVNDRWSWIQGAKAIRKTQSRWWKQQYNRGDIAKESENANRGVEEHEELKSTWRKDIIPQ